MSDLADRLYTALLVVAMIVSWTAVAMTTRCTPEPACTTPDDCDRVADSVAQTIDNTETGELP